MRPTIPTKKRTGLLAGTIVLALTVAVGCSDRGETNMASTSAGTTATQSTNAGLQINGAGATFPYPIYSKWFSEYAGAHPDVKINYQSIGSGGGIRQLTNKTVFFGATDGPMTDEQLKAAPGQVLHFATVLGGVVPVYNLAGISQPLQLSGDVIADIILGKITKWNDPRLVKANSGVKLPAEAITVVHRSDGSGTSYIFTDYLSKVSAEFQKTVGRNTSVQWPTGVGAKGNEGVAGMVKQTPGAFGYVELIYALQNNIDYGLVQNPAGKFVKATTETVTNAAASAVSNMPEDFRVSITNAAGADAYPISSFTWLIMYQNPDDKARGKMMVDFVKWAITDGQQFTKELGYAPLPKEVVDKEMQYLQRIQL